MTLVAPLELKRSPHLSCEVKRRGLRNSTVHLTNQLTQLGDQRGKTTQEGLQGLVKDGTSSLQEREKRMTTPAYRDGQTDRSIHRQIAR